MEEVLCYELEIVPTGITYPLSTKDNRPASWNDALAARYGNKPQEYFGALYLDLDYNAIGHVLLAIGTSRLFVVEPGMVIVPALRLAAKGMILFHNHPLAEQGKYLEPSREDIELTRRLAGAAELIRCQVLDHIILGRECWASIGEQAGLLRHYPRQRVVG